VSGGRKKSGGFYIACGFGFIMSCFIGCGKIIGLNWRQFGARLNNFLKFV
jgi:hypothetical protein